ncbi:MAG: hypothetical protein SGJ27_13530 [Candidatus Melainabacteria bacterium]|nr:hypothetical protein [Candidatus Melainabacteria bacterium]
MYWPSAQDYNEAIQNPSTSFVDRDLRAGTVESNRLGLPKVMSGAFASVYKINSGDAPWAVRCFLNNKPDHQERYKFISEFVLFDDLEATVPFYFLEQGIKIKGNWYPILKMEWVEGRTLEKFLDENFNKKHLVLDILKQFDELILDLNRAGIAHGDLQHGNILVTDAGLRLVDYDALYVPALKGWQSPEVGHPNFQHPLRSAKDFDPGVDNFSAWLIHFSLLALSIDSELYRLAEGGDDSILFKRSDFLNPQRSELFRILFEHPATELRQAGLMLTAMLAVEPSAIPALSAEADELSLLPDMSSLFLEDSDENSESVQSLNSSVANFSERVSKLLPQNISRIQSADGREVIVREAYDPGSAFRPQQEMHVKLALLNRNVTANIRASVNSWYLRKFPRHWCIGNLKKATMQFDQSNYESAIPVYLELADVFQILANDRNFWKAAARRLGAFLPRAIYLSGLFFSAVMIVSVVGWNAVSLWLAAVGWFFVDAALPNSRSTLNETKFEPDKLLVETHLSLGYCFCFSNQWRVASNFFTMALRGCKWGIDPELRKRSLLLYAVCRNEGGERKEAIRFLSQKPEVMENLPRLVDAENRGLQLTKRLSAFQLFFELGQSYIHKRLLKSAESPLVAARKIYEQLSPEDQAQCDQSAREMFLSLAYIYTIRSNWTEAQSMFNNLIVHCTNGNTKALWMAEFCAALSSNLRGDVTGATALMLRSKFQPGALLNEIVDKESIAHKILFYERSRGIAFLQELGVRLKENKRHDHLMDICSILMYVLRCDTAPKPVFRITWFDELDDEFISECLRRSYFDNRQPTSNELTVLIDAAVAASLNKTVLILGQVMLKDNMLDKVDHLLNRMEALSQLHRLLSQNQIELESRVDRFFIDVIFRMAADQFKEVVSRESIAQLGLKEAEGAEGEEDEGRLTVKTLVDCIVSCEEGARKSVSDIIYGAFDSPSIFKSEYLQYRGILRFIELYLADRLAACDMYEDSLILYDRLEGHYSTNIDRVLDKAIAALEQIECSHAEWFHHVVRTSHLTGVYRGDAGGKHLTQIKEIVSMRTRSHFTSSQNICIWQTAVVAVESYDRAALAVLDTVCDTVMMLIQESFSGGKESALSTDKLAMVNDLCQFIVAISAIYLDHNAPEAFSKHQKILIEHIDDFSEPVAVQVRLVSSILLRKTGADREAAAILDGVVDSAALLEYVLTDDTIVKMLLRERSEAVELFLEAGDMTRDDDFKSRCFYLTAAFFYNALPLSTASRVLSQKLSTRLGDPPGSANIESEISKYRGFATDRKVDSL